jgi:methyltransferase
MFVAAAALLAVAERALALGNERRLLREGAEEIAPRVFLFMAPAYALIFPCAVAEHLALGRRPGRGWVAAAVLLFAAAKALKGWAVRHLGGAWTMRVVVPRVLGVVTTGPYRYIRHPNYVAAMAEAVALPLAGGAWITAAAGGLLFALVLAARIRTEEAALLGRPEYRAAMARKRRFLPVVLALALGAGGGAAGAWGAAADAPAASAPEGRPLALDPAASALRFTVSRPGEVVEGTAPEFAGEAVFDPARPGEGSSVVLRVVARSLVTGNRLRDRKMRKSHLESERFPEIVFRSTSIQAHAAGGPLRPGEERRVLIEGILSLHGVDRTILFPAAIRYDAGSLTAEGELRLRLTDHAIPIPRFLWMVLDDEVVVHFRFVAAPASAPAGGPGGPPGGPP